jgi:predicted RNase H-like HicB family nuclease
MTACTIVIEPLDDGRYRATCHLFPDCEVVAATEEAAREGFQAVIAEVLSSRREEEEPTFDDLPPACDL